MSETTKCAILLEISSGTAKRLPFSSDSLKDDNVIAIMDEIHEVIWLWMGKDTGLIMRRGSMRVARSLKAYGHEIGPSIVGRKLKDVVPVDGKKIETDSNEKAKFEKVISLFTKEHTLKAEVLAEYRVLAEIEQPKYYGLSKSQRDDLVEAAITAPSAGDDSRKIEEIVGEFRPTIPDDFSTATTIQKPILKPTPKPIPKQAPKSAPKAADVLPPPITPTQTLEIHHDLPDTTRIEIPEPTSSLKEEEEEELIGEVKAAIVISSILSEYTDIFIGVKIQEGHRTFTVESQDGLICKYFLDKSKIQFLPGSWDKIGAEQKRKIQKLFIERVKKLIGS